MQSEPLEGILGRPDESNLEPVPSQSFHVPPETKSYSVTESHLIIRGCCSQPQKYDHTVAAVLYSRHAQQAASRILHVGCLRVFDG